MADQKIKFIPPVVWIILPVLVAICLWVIAGKTFSSNISTMLPDDSTSAKMLDALEKNRISGRFLLELRMKDRKTDSAVLLEAADILLKKLKHPEIIRMTHHFNVPDMEKMMKLYQLLPCISDKEMITKVAELSSPENIRNKMKKNFLTLTAPGGIGAAGFIEADPLGFNRLVMPGINRLARAFNYKLQTGASRIIGYDGTRALIVIETDIPVVNITRSAELLDYIDKQVQALNLPVEATVLCGHRHSIDNARIIRSDIVKVSLASILIFAVMFILIYRFEYQCFYIIIIPAVSVLFSITLLALFVESLSGFIIGLGGVIAGIAVDYGIHVYSACAKGGGTHIRGIIRPLIGGAVTTMGIFAAFFFSGVDSYIILGIFAVLSVLISLTMSIFLLPVMIGPKKLKPSAVKLKMPVYSRKGAIVCLVIWGVLVIAALLSLPKLKVANDVNTMDGAGKQIIADEKSFRDYWTGKADNAMLIVTGKTREDVLRLAEKIYPEVAKLTDNGYISPVSIMPSDKTERENRKRWQTFWSPEHLKHLRAVLSKEAVASGFAPKAFDAFVDSLSDTSGGDKAVIELLGKYFVRQHKNGSWKLFSFFPDRLEYFNALSRQFGDNENIALISPAVLYDRIGDELFGRLVSIGLWSILLVALLSIIVTRSLYRGGIALLPVVIALVMIAGICALFGVSVSVPVGVAAVIVIGLAIDYGIFLVYQAFGMISDNVTSAVMLSALTTIAGGGSLILASHPVLFNLGVFLTLGVFLAALAAFTMIPALATLLGTSKKSHRVNAVILISLVMLIVTGCSSLPEPLPLAALQSGDIKTFNPPGGKWSSVAQLTFSFRGHDFSVLSTAEIDSINRKIALVGLNASSGIRVLELVAVNGKIEHQYVIPQLAKLKNLPRDVALDMSKISFNLRPTGDRISVGDGMEQVQQGNTIWLFDRKSSLLAEKKYMDGDRCDWKICFREYKLFQGFTVPLKIQLLNYRTNYSILIDIREFEFIEGRANVTR